MTPYQRAELLAELNAYAALPVTGADAILDEIELGSRVAMSLAESRTA